MNLKYRVHKIYTRFFFNIGASENPLYLFYYRHLYKPRARSLDEFLSDYSKKHAPVTFLQVGANDGFVHDPLYKFIKRDNWKGVMLEPLPDVFRDSLVKVHRKRPEVIPVNAALARNDGTRPLYKIAISDERWATGMSTLDRDVLVKKLKKGTIQYKARKRGIRLPEKEEDMIVEEEIATISPETLLGKFGREGFKLLAVDAEGFDYEVIRMLDLNRISPEVILYEEVNLDAATAAECRSYLEGHGYSCQAIGKDIIATRL